MIICCLCKIKITEEEVAGGNHFFNRYYCVECWNKTYPDQQIQREEKKKEISFLEGYLTK